MLAYQNLIRDVRNFGVLTPNPRGNVATIRLPGAMMRFNPEDGAPIVTSKKLAFKSVVGELCAFLRASRSAADFRALGCKVWDANANENNEDGSPNPWLANQFRQGEDDIGPVYGVQWREWPGFKYFDDYEMHLGEIKQAESMGWEIILLQDRVDQPQSEKETKRAVVMYKSIDQLGDCVRQIIKSPNGRRILFHAWNPAVLDEIALPACHLLYQFLPDPVNHRLNMILYVRSNDVGLGTPFNMAEGAALQHLIARLTGYAVGTFTYFIGDAHIYTNQTEYLDELLTKVPLPLPTLKISDRVPTFRSLLDPFDPIGLDLAAEEAIKWLRLVEPSDFTLENYSYHTLVTPVPKMVI